MRSDHRRLRATLTGHEASVRAVACTVLDGRPVAVSAYTDKTMRVWDLTTTSELVECYSGDLITSK